MYKFLLCTRYLKTRYIAMASIISVMLGVATMIVVNSVMAGFSSEMRGRIHGILSDMVLEATSMDGTPDVERQMRTIQAAAGEYIEAMSPTVEVYGILSFRYGGQWIPRPVTIIGIEPASKAKVGDLVKHLENYQESRDEKGNIIPAALARSTSRLEITRFVFGVSSHGVAPAAAVDAGSIRKPTTIRKPDGMQDPARRPWPKRRFITRSKKTMRCGPMQRSTTGR